MLFSHLIFHKQFVVDLWHVWQSYGDDACVNLQRMCWHSFTLMPVIGPLNFCRLQVTSCSLFSSGINIETSSLRVWLRELHVCRTGAALQRLKLTFGLVSDIFSIMPALPLGITTRLVSFLTQAVSTFLLVAIFFFLQYIFDMEFKCTCKPGVDANTVLFMVLPPLILAWFVNIINPIHKRKIFIRWYFQERDVFCGCVWKGIMDYICLLIVWFTAVLFKGDWYLCLWTNLREDHTGIPCRTNLTFEEEQIKAEYKNDSLVSSRTQHLIMKQIFWAFSVGLLKDKTHAYAIFEILHIYDRVFDIWNVACTCIYAKKRKRLRDFRVFKVEFKSTAL